MPNTSMVKLCFVFYKSIMRSRIFWSVCAGPCNVVKPGSLVAAKRAVENAKDLTSDDTQHLQSVVDV